MKLEEFEKLSSGGELYDSGDPSIIVRQFGLQDKVRRYNKTHCSPLGYLIRSVKLKKMFASVGKGVYIEPPFHANWGGKIAISATAFMRISILRLLTTGKLRWETT